MKHSLNKFLNVFAIVIFLVIVVPTFANANSNAGQVVSKNLSHIVSDSLSKVITMCFAIITLLLAFYALFSNFAIPEHNELGSYKIRELKIWLLRQKFFYMPFGKAIFFIIEFVLFILLVSILNDFLRFEIVRNILVILHMFLFIFIIHLFFGIKREIIPAYNHSEALKKQEAKLRTNLTEKNRLLLSKILESVNEIKNK